MLFGFRSGVRSSTSSTTLMLLILVASAFLLLVQFALHAHIDDAVHGLRSLSIQRRVHDLRLRWSAAHPSLFAKTTWQSNTTKLADLPFFQEKVDDFLLRVAHRMSYSQLDTTPDTIFVAIPSYRDSECATTVNDAFEKALNPSNVFVGLVDQLLPSEDTPCIEGVDEKWRRNIRFFKVDATESDGPNTARYIISKLWDGEKHYFSIDAHTRFMKDWDSVLIRMMATYPTNAIVTHYPVAKREEIGDNGGHIPWICKGHFRGPQHLIVQECGECHDVHRRSNSSCVGPFLGAGFLFGRSTLLTASPPDRYLPMLFHGEELLLAARLWTSGFEFYSPTTNVIAHVYGERDHSVFRENVKNQQQARKTHERVLYLLGVIESEPEDKRELSSLGMGTKRTLSAYMEFAGLDLRNDKIEHRCDSSFDWENNKWVHI